MITLIRKTTFDLRQQFSKSFSRLLLTFLPTVFILIVFFLLNRLFRVPTAVLMRDTISLGGVHPWAGIGSNIGVLMWCAAATICFVTAAHIHINTGKAEAYWFMITAGYFTTFMLLDDFFLLHESFRDYLGFPERAFYAIYLLLWLLFLLRFWRYILQTEYLFMLIGLFFLAGSFFMDLIQDLITEFIPFFIYYLIEDGLKLLGITGWLGYFANNYYQGLRKDAS